MNTLYKLLMALGLLCVSTSSLSGERAKRIIALSPHAVEMLYAIGAGGSIVATTDHADYPSSALSIPRIGGYHGIQIERVLELNPDLVVVWSDGNKAEDIQRIKELGFNIFDSSPKTLEAVADELEQLGELTGNQTKANHAALNYRQKLATLKQKNIAKPEVKVFYQLWSTPLMTVAKHSWIQQIIAVCHGDNVFLNAANEYPQVSLEAVLLKMPEVILQSQDEGNIQGINWSQWSEIPAVKEGKIYQLNADLLHRATPRALLGVEALCGALDKARNPGV